jgi:mannose/fructose/N-acetylgalactosamine-specific phosphotransferase system component IIC
MSVASTVAVLALTAGALALDTTAAFQIMLSQPLMAGSIAGVIVGDPALGAAVGATLQLIWVGVLPVGAAPFPDAAPATIVGVGLAHLLSRAEVGPGWSLAAGILVAFGAAVAGRLLVRGVRRLNIRLSELAESRADRGEPKGVAMAVVLGLTIRYIAGAVVAATFLGAAAAILPRVLPSGAGGAFPTLLWAAPVGVAAVAVAARGGLERAFLIGGFAVGLLIVCVT